uniref:HPS6 biogenesis of lysosomal organelles complex 2 subunit 3 n=1 Tax=Neogobius melanostomus TaxID=47308 RepID=A0A8C6ST92_9GOBI
ELVVPRLNITCDFSLALARLPIYLVSPDGRHIHFILRKPTAGLVTCDKYDRPKLALSQRKQDLRITRTVPIVNVFYLESNVSDAALVAVIYETGKAEFWKFQQESNPGWHLLQTSDLCNSPRAKVVSVCASANSIIWCEERPPSESSPVLSSTRNKLRFCVCRRDFEVDEGSVVLRGVKMALHNNPKFNVVSSGEYVHLLPDSKIKALSSLNKIIISWSPRIDTFRLSTTCKTTPLKEDVLSTKESDFKRLLTDCLGFLSIQEPPEICCYSPTGCGGLLLLLSTGWVCLLQKDGILRQVHKVDDNIVDKFASHISLCLYQETLALLTEHSLHLIDIDCGTEHGDVVDPAVFEEACTYYQQRSLADKLMSSLEPDLKALVALEEVKCRLVKGSVQEVEMLSDNLVEMEVSRLLLSPDLDKDSLLYLNTIFTLFPCQSWRAVKVTLQLHYNGEGRLSSNAPQKIWKTVLSPVKSPSVPAVLPVFELLCHSVFLYEPSWFPSFLELSQQQQGSAGLALSLASSSWGFSSGRGAESSDSSVPLYKRALSVVSSLSTDRDHNQDLQVELLLVSGRPNAILQAMRILMGKQQWEKVTQVAQKYCTQSPLLNKEMFSTLLCEVAQHRELDPYLELLWSLCPEDLTVTNILSMYSYLCPAPFADPQSSQLTIGLLKPLLRKVLERETKSNQGYADILQSPSYPPPAPPRQAVQHPRTGTSRSTESDQDIASAGPETT